jgi:diaminopimelate epimerase
MMNNRSLKIPFAKISGAGNDFLLIEEDHIPADARNYGLLAQAACDRHRGVGADGLLVLRHIAGHAFEMGYYNADGSTGGMCGNGARCIATYYFDRYGVDRDHITFVAFDHVYSAIRANGTVSIGMKDTSHILTDLTIDVDGRSIRCNYIDTGAPHAVIFLEDMPGPDRIDDIDVASLGRKIRRHEAFRPLGTNVNFVSRVAPSRIRVRTYERGVEAETLACGTGSVAAAVLTALRTEDRSPFTVITTSGEMLTVHYTLDAGRTSATDIRLSGPVSYLCTGTILFDAEQGKCGVPHLPEDLMYNGSHNKSEHAPT